MTTYEPVGQNRRLVSLERDLEVAARKQGMAIVPSRSVRTVRLSELIVGAVIEVLVIVTFFAVVIALSIILGGPR